MQTASAYAQQYGSNAPTTYPSSAQQSPSLQVGGVNLVAEPVTPEQTVAQIMALQEQQRRLQEKLLLQKQNPSAANVLQPPPPPPPEPTQISTVQTAQERKRQEDLALLATLKSQQVEIERLLAEFEARLKTEFAYTTVPLEWQSYQYQVRHRGIKSVD